MRWFSILFCGLLSLFIGRFAFAQQRPNVILFISDDVSWNDHGCYGNPAARTPVIDQLAARGLRFDQAFLTASSCSPSRSSIITGRYPHNNGKAAELHQPISANLAWFPAMLKEAGYYTVLSGKNHMSGGKLPAGTTASRHNKAWHHTSGGSGKRNTGGHANWVKEVQKRPRDKPFFFLVCVHRRTSRLERRRRMESAVRLQAPSEGRDRTAVPDRFTRYTKRSGLVLQRSDAVRFLHRRSRP